jgi:hypothetical protein
MELLTRILEQAVDAGVDIVQLERNRGTLEIMFCSGNTGIGSVLNDRTKADNLLETIYDLAGLEKKVRGKFKITLKENEYTIQAKQYESFGETCIELKFVKPKK